MHGHAGEERQALERAGHAGPAPPVRAASARRRAPPKSTRPVLGLLQSGEHVEHRRLAGAVRADETDDPARRHVETSRCPARSGRRTAPRSPRPPERHWRRRTAGVGHRHGAIGHGPARPSRFRRVRRRSDSGRPWRAPRQRAQDAQDVARLAPRQRHRALGLLGQADHAERHEQRDELLDLGRDLRQRAGSRRPPRRSRRPQMSERPPSTTTSSSASDADHMKSCGVIACCQAP